MVVSKRFTSTFLLKVSCFSTQFLASANSVWSEAEHKSGRGKTEKRITFEYIFLTSWIKDVYVLP